MKVPAGLPLACCCWLVMATVSTLARPQKLQFTDREFKAFKTVLGNNRALSITSAIPVMAFSDKNPTKYVQLPFDHVGGATGHPSPAELLVTSEEFETVLGRGAGRSGPAFGVSEQGRYQGFENFNAGDHQRGGGDFDSSAGDSSAFGPNKIVPLTYGFKPIYDSIGTNKATGGLVHTAFSPSTQVGQGGFRPIGSIEGGDDLNLDLNVLGRKPHLESGENLYRHHVNKNLIPSNGGGPRSTAVKKLVKSQENALDNSDVVARSVDGRSILNDLLKETNGKKLIDVSGGALHSSAAVGASITVRGSSQGQLQSFKEDKLPFNHLELTSTGFVSDSGAIVVRGGDTNGRETLPDPSASVFDSSRIEASSIFASNSIQIPQLPNVQLPLQTQEARSFEGQDLPLQLSQSSFTGNQQQVKLITETSHSQKRQVPKIPSSVTPKLKNTATASTESLLRLLRSQSTSESEPSTNPGKFTREISPQARQIPGAIPSRILSPASASVSSNAVPQGFRPIPATPRQNGGRNSSPNLDQKRTNIAFDAASQKNLRSQAIPTHQAPLTRSIEQPRTSPQFPGAVSHQSQVQFHPQFSPGPFSQNPQVNPSNQLQKLQQRQRQQEQEQQHREQQQEKRRDQLKEQQVLQQVAERQQKQEQRQQQQSQQLREKQVRDQHQQQQSQQLREQQGRDQHQQQQSQQQQREQKVQQQQQQRGQQVQQQQVQQQQQQQQQQQNPQQQPKPLQQQKQQQQQQSQLQQQLQHQERENQQRSHQQQQQQQQLNQQQSERIGTKVTTGQRQTLQEFLSGDAESVSKFQQTPRLSQATIPGRISQQPALQQTQTVVISKSNSQQPSLQQSKATLATTSGSQQHGLQVGKATTSGSNSALSQLSQQQRFVQRPTSGVAQVVSNQQVLAQPQLKAVQTSAIQSAQLPSSQSLSSSTSPGGTTVISASSGSSIGSLPPSALQALGALGGGGAGGGQSHIVVKTLSLDAKDADPNSEAFKKALAEATKQARLELGVRDSEELGVASGDLANLFGKRRRKRQLFGEGNASSAQTVGNALSTGAGLFDNDDDHAHEEFE